MSQAETSVPYPKNTEPSIRQVNVVARKTPPHKFLENKKGEEIHWDSSNIAQKDLLFLRNCSDLVLKISTPFTKLLIGTLKLVDSSKFVVGRWKAFANKNLYFSFTESCNNVTIHAPEKIMTNMIEIWKSKNVTIHVRQILKLFDDAIFKCSFVNQSLTNTSFYC